MSCLSLEAGTSPSNILMCLCFKIRRRFSALLKIKQIPNKTNAYLCSKASIYVKIPNN